MTWGAVELEPEVRDWLEALPTEMFARAAFYVDLLAQRGPLLGEPYSRQLDGNCGSCGFTSRARHGGSPTGLHQSDGSCS